MFTKELNQELVVLLVSVTIRWPRVHIHMCITISLLESGIKTGFWTIPLCSKHIALCYINTKNNSKVHYSYNGNWCTAGYGDLIIALGDLINNVVFDKWFPAKYLLLWLLHHPSTLWNLYVTALIHAIYMLY